MGRPWAQAYFNPENGWTVAYWQDSGRAGSADSWTTFPTEEGARGAAARYNEANSPAAARKELRLDVTAIANVDRDSKREPYKISEPPRDDHAVVSMMLRDTITARMMRYLADRGEVTQAEFMNEYHRRCERTNPSRSSFGNNFGRFTYGKFHVIERVYVGRDGKPVVHRRDTDRRGRIVVKLRWCGPTPQQMVAILERDPKLHSDAYGNMERMLLDHRATDDELEIYQWLKLVKDLQVEPSKESKPMTDGEQVVAIMFKHEDQIRRQPVGPVWKKLKDGTVINYQDHESMVSPVSKKPTPKWFTLAQARAFATSLGVPLEER